MEGTWDPDNTNNWWWLRSPMLPPRPDPFVSFVPFVPSW
jgi:hypothetical protein